MATKIKHVAIVSDDYALLGRFYEALFGMRTSPGARPEAAVSISDGYVGMNVNPRGPGRQAGFDHFGFEPDDVERVFARARERYPECRPLRRPGSRPFAGISMHDPAGNVFDLGKEDAADVYADVTREGPHERHIDHFVLRVMDPPRVAGFYRDVLELAEAEGASEGSFAFTDGVVTLVIAPWLIADYEGGSIDRPAPDHIGFRVESVEGFKADLQRIVARNAKMTPKPFKGGGEGNTRIKIVTACPYGSFEFCDPDGVMLHVRGG